MLSIRAALDLMLPSFQPLGVERVPLLAANGRVLGADLSAQFDLPEFDNSAMDGYAVSHAQLVAGGLLPVLGESRAGVATGGVLASDSAVRIFTGAQLPSGADTVVMQENVERRGDAIAIRELPRPGANVRRQASDIRCGQALLSAGAQLGPAELGLLAAQGYGQLDVYRRPRVAILATGDELRALDAPRAPGTIVNSNSYALAAAVQQLGCEALPLGIVGDRLDEIARGLQAGLAADVLLTVGGVSVGDYDLVAQALQNAGVAITFHKVAIKPGKPLLFGVRGTTPVIGLPGNPVSALVTFHVFLRPCLQRMLGHTAIFSDPLDVVLAEGYQHSPGRTEFVRARLSRVESQWVAHLHPRQGSASLQSLVAHDALVVLPAHSTHFAKGQRLQALRTAEARSSRLSFDE